MATSKIQLAISSGMDNLKNAQKNLSQMPSNVANQVSNIKENTKKNILNSIDWAKGNLTMYHYAAIAVIIAIIVYNVNAVAKYNKKNPTLFPSPSDGREYISPASSNFKSLQQKREYSYTIWMYVDNMDYNFNKYKHVFTRGNATDFKTANTSIDELDKDGNSIHTDENGTAILIEQIAAPGIWIDKIKNNLIFKMSTVREDDKSVSNGIAAPGTPISDRVDGEDVCILTPENTSEVHRITMTKNKCDATESQPSWGCDAFMIEDFPLKEWFCVGVVVKDREIDLFFNGDLTYTGSLRGPPKEEDTNQVKIAGIGDPSATGSNGWAGSYRNIGMYTYPLSAIEMKKIYYNGPENREYYLKWLYFFTDPIMNLISSEKRKDLILKSNYLRESETSITNMNDDDASEAHTFNNTLKEKTEGLFKKGDRVFYLAKGAEEKLAAYISDGPNVDETSPDTGELTYDIILEKHNYDSTAVPNNIITDVIQSRLSKDINSKSYYGLAMSITVIILIIGVIVYYKIY